MHNFFSFKRNTNRTTLVFLCVAGWAGYEEACPNRVPFQSRLHSFPSSFPLSKNTPSDRLTAAALGGDGGGTLFSDLICKSVLSFSLPLPFYYHFACFLISIHTLFSKIFK